MHTHLFSHSYSTEGKCIWRAKDFHLMIIIPVREKFSLALVTALLLKFHACVEICELLEVGIFWINESMSILSLKYLLNNGDWQSARAVRQRRVSAVRLFCPFSQIHINVLILGEWQSSMSYLFKYSSPWSKSLRTAAKIKKNVVDPRPLNKDMEPKKHFKTVI